MPFNGSGTYSAPASSWNPAVDNTDIDANDWIALLADLTTALSTCVLKDGTQTPTANIPMGGFKFTGLAAGSASGNSLRYEQVNGVVTTAGDTLYASGAGALARLAVGAAKTRLAVNSGATAPEWVADTQNTVVTAAGDLLQASGSGVLARLAIGALGTRLHSTGSAAEWQGTWFKIVSNTRVMHAANGTVAYTGAGFTPKAAILIGGRDSVSGTVSMGFTDGTLSGCISIVTAFASMYFAANTLVFDEGGGATQAAVFSAWGSDGMSLTWTKNGAPSGNTQTFQILYIR